MTYYNKIKKYTIWQHTILDRCILPWCYIWILVCCTCYLPLLVFLLVAGSSSCKKFIGKISGSYPQAIFIDWWAGANWFFFCLHEDGTIRGAYMKVGQCMKVGPSVGPIKAWECPLSYMNVGQSMGPTWVWSHPQCHHRGGTTVWGLYEG